MEISSSSHTEIPPSDDGDDKQAESEQPMSAVTV